MHVVRFLPLALCLCFFCVGSFQAQTIPELKISIEKKNYSLKEILNKISSKANIRFSYNPKRMKTDRKVDYQAIDKLVSEIMIDLAMHYDFQYSVVEDQVVLKPGAKSQKTEESLVTLHGYIRSKADGEALIGATLFFKELKTGTVTNSAGFFSITLPAGSYEITASFIGYRPVVKTIVIPISTMENILLMEEPPVLDEIIVTPAEEDVEQVEVSKVNIKPSAVEERPALFGEMDVVKSLESVPGFKLHSEGSTFYYVRGGQRDQNLVLMDDSPIYNPSHLLGLFSTIIPDAVTDINIYKGDIPASMGGRLSSTLEIHTKKGNDQVTQIWGNLGVTSTRVGVEGPIKKNTSSYLVSGRFSRLKWIFQGLDPAINKFNFYDLTGKINFKLNSGNRIFFSFYTGADNYFSGNNGINWANRALTFRWNTILSNRLFLNTTLSASGYDYNLYTNVAEDERWNSHISNINLKSDFSYFVKPQSEITFGVGLNGYRFNPGNLQTGSINQQVSNTSVRNSLEFVLYGNQELFLNKHWGLNYGIRFSTWTNTGEAFEYEFDSAGNPLDTTYYQAGESYITFANLEPRITLQYLVNEHASLKASYMRNVQNIHLISNSISPFTSLDVWLPSSYHIQPQRADQLTLGYHDTHRQTGITWVVESFYKRMYNQIEYENHAMLLVNPLFENQLRFGTGTAYGFELQVKKEQGRLRGMAGYSYARAKRKFEDINDGRPFNAFGDRPNQINLALSYDLNLRWMFSLDWNYMTGAPYSSPISFYRFNDLETPIYGLKNNDRLPDYHRLDVSATWKLNRNLERKFKHSLTFAVYNAYGRKNSVFVNYNKTELGYRDFKIDSNLLENERVISQFFLFQVTPSVSYTFKWR